MQISSGIWYRWDVFISILSERKDADEKLWESSVLQLGSNLWQIGVEFRAGDLFPDSHTWQDLHRSFIYRHCLFLYCMQWSQLSWLLMPPKTAEDWLQIKEYKLRFIAQICVVLTRLNYGILATLHFLPLFVLLMNKSLAFFSSTSHKTIHYPVSELLNKGGILQNCTRYKDKNYIFDGLWIPVCLRSSW